MRPFLVAAIISAIALFLASTPPVKAENSCTAPYRTAEWVPEGFKPDARRDDAGWWAMIIGVGIVAGVLGWMAGRPSQIETLEKLEKAFKTRRHEANVHSRRKLPAPLAEARRAVLKGMEELGHIAPGWPTNPPP